MAKKTLVLLEIFKNHTRSKHLEKIKKSPNYYYDVIIAKKILSKK
jgi:hypothetical protein